MLPPPLVALTPGDLGPRDVPELLARVRAALEGGLRGVLLREPELDDRPFLDLARALRELLDASGTAGERAWLGVHDRAHLAAVSGADGLHLGFRSLRPGEVPAAWRTGVAVGRSTHAGDEAASWSGADYLFHGPVRATPSKEGLKEPVGLGGLERFAARAELPVLAIGGLAPEHAAACLAHGARGVAVLRGVLGASDPAAAAAAYLAALEGAAEGPR